MTYLTEDEERPLIQQLVIDEGFRKFPYNDATGTPVLLAGANLTIGIGFNISAGIDYDDAVYLCKSKLKKCQAELLKINAYNKCNLPRKYALLNMCYNMGWRSLWGFRQMFLALDAEDYEKAAHEVLDSDAARKLPVRYKRIAEMIRTGQLQN